VIHEDTHFLSTETYRFSTYQIRWFINVTSTDMLSCNQLTAQATEGRLSEEIWKKTREHDP